MLGVRGEVEKKISVVLFKREPRADLANYFRLGNGTRSVNLTVLQKPKNPQVLDARL